MKRASVLVQEGRDGKERTRELENGHSKQTPSVGGVRKSLRFGQDSEYQKELRRLQTELVKFQEWVRHKGLKVVVIFEGRDAAGKGGAIKSVPFAGCVLHGV